MLRETLLSLLRREHSLKLTDGLANLRLIAGVVEQSAAKETATVFEHRYREVAVLIAALRSSAIGRLQREAINQIELTPHYDSSSAFSCLLNLEIASIEAEVIRILAEEERINALFQAISFLVGATVHE